MAEEQTVKTLDLAGAGTGGALNLGYAEVDFTQLDACWSPPGSTTGVELVVIGTIQVRYRDAKIVLGTWDPNAQADNEIVPHPAWVVDVCEFSSSNSSNVPRQYGLNPTYPVSMVDPPGVNEAPMQLPRDPSPSVLVIAKDRTGTMRKVRVLLH